MQKRSTGIFATPGKSSHLFLSTYCVRVRSWQCVIARHFRLPYLGMVILPHALPVELVIEVNANRATGALVREGK